jgi:hypothetical protein
MQMTPGTSSYQQRPFLPPPRLRVTDSTFVQDISSSLRNRTLAVFDLKKSESQDRYIVPSPNKQEPRASVLSALLAAIEERHRHRNWDGEDAEPITDETLSLTRTFRNRTGISPLTGSLTTNTMSALASVTIALVGCTTLLGATTGSGEPEKPRRVREFLLSWLS